MEKKDNDTLQNEEVKRVLDRMRALCAVREYCEKDIREKVAKTLRSGEGESGESGDESAVQCGVKGRGDESAGQCGVENVTDAVIEKLKVEGFLSDRRYAAAFARDKAHLLGWGPQKIRYALLSKQIDEATVNEALESVDVRAAQAQLERMVTKKLSALRASKRPLSDNEIKAGLIRFATGRGYRYDAIVSAIAKVWNGISE